MIAHLVGFGIGIALALGGGHVHQHRAFAAVSLLERSHQAPDVMAIDRAHVGEAKLLEDSAHLGNRQALHALLEPVELSRHLPLHEGQMAHRFFRAAGQELHGRAEPHAVEVIGEGPNRW